MNQEITVENAKKAQKEAEWAYNNAMENSIPQCWKSFSSG